MWGLMAGLRGLLAMGSVLLSRGWLVTVKVPGHTGHPPSTQLDAVVNLSFDVRMIFGHAFETPQVTLVLSSPVKAVAKLCLRQRCSNGCSSLKNFQLDSPSHFTASNLDSQTLENLKEELQISQVNVQNCMTCEAMRNLYC